MTDSGDRLGLGFQTSFTLTGTDLDTDSDSKPDGYIVLWKTCPHCTDSDSDPLVPNWDAFFIIFDIENMELGGGGNPLDRLSECEIEINFYRFHFFSSFSSSFFASLPRLVLFRPAEPSTERSVPEIPSAEHPWGLH